MCNLFKRIYNKRIMITDFDRNPFYFFRGPSPASHLTAYWTNDIVLARHRNSKEILKANVSVRNPLIVDCKNTGWDQPEKNKVTLYPKKPVKILLVSQRVINIWHMKIVGQLTMMFFWKSIKIHMTL